MIRHLTTFFTIAIAITVTLLGVSAEATLPMHPDLQIYEAARILELPAQGTAPSFASGFQVVERDGQGFARRVRIRMLVDNPGYAGQLAVIGPFNNWKPRAQDYLLPVANQTYMMEGVIEGLQHGMTYRLLLNGRQVIDPMARMYTTPEYLYRAGVLGQGDFLNSVFWDHEDPRVYKKQTGFVDIADRPNMIAEIEAGSLAGKFPTRDGRGPRVVADTYAFIARSGVTKTMRDAGYNAVEFVPFNQSVDGESWHFRYQVYGNYAPDSRYGSPAEFKEMVDSFHANGIAVVMDTVFSHFPVSGNSGSRRLEEVGLQHWYKVDGRPLYVGTDSPWGTKRYDYSNPFVRRFLIDGVIYMMAEYGIDGIRIDNLDGVLGSPGGPVMLKDLSDAIRRLNPHALIIGEAFFPPNYLLHRLNTNQCDGCGFGVNTRNDSNFFDRWKDMLLGRTEEMSVNSFKELLRSIWGWREVPLLRYLTNHDESANGRGGFTGAYPQTLLNPSNDPRIDYYAFNKVKMADSLNMLAGAYYLSFVQSRMAQTGTFYNNPAIDWGLITQPDSRGRKLWDYFAALGQYVQSRWTYFNFRSLHPDVENHADNTGKVISLHRRDPATGRSIYAVINMGDHMFPNYRFGVSQGGAYRMAFDSDRPEFGGEGRNSPKQVYQAGVPEHGRPYSLTVPWLMPYSVTIFEPAL